MTSKTELKLTPVELHVLAQALNIMNLMIRAALKKDTKYMHQALDNIEQVIFTHEESGRAFPVIAVELMHDKLMPVLIAQLDELDAHRGVQCTSTDLLRYIDKELN